uniref:Uncharacterized protein n=1 Tax=Rhizophora mucronata TaxID=61149 RepID=A0A2P2KNG3_RHIMU
MGTLLLRQRSVCIIIITILYKYTFIFQFSLLFIIYSINAH